MKQILEMVKEGKQCWIGKRPPYDMDAIDMCSGTNYRVSSALHHSYNVVWYYEECLDDLGILSWRIALDEMIRLLQEDGKLIIRMRKNAIPSIETVKLFLGRSITFNTSLEYETENESDHTLTAVYNIKRCQFDSYSDKSWTLGILTTGNKVDEVVRFLHTVRSDCDNKECQILIAGPQNEAYDSYNVSYVDCSGIRPEYAEICKKKNRIIDMAIGKNIMILHDRYYLTRDFFQKFDEYGYDFDFLTVTQLNEEGVEFPGYAATVGGMLGKRSFKVNDLTHVYDTSYVNGGLMIFKTEMIKKVRYNELLLWKQMEDVELTRELMERSVIPRVNYLSVAVALPTRADSFFYEGLEEADVDIEILEQIGMNGYSSNPQKRMLSQKLDAISMKRTEFLLYGAGKRAEQIYNFMGEESRKQISAVLVDDIEKNARMFHDIPICDYRDYINSEKKILIALATKAAKEVHDQLLKAGIDDDRLMMLSESEQTALRLP